MEQLREGVQRMEHRSLAPDLIVSDDNDACGNQRAGESAPNVASGELREEKQVGGPVNCSDSELCTFLQGLEGGFLPTYYSDTSQYVQSKSMSIASRSYQRGKKTVVFHGFPSLQMSRSLTESRGAGLLAWFLEDFRARTSAPLAREQESTENDPACGGRWRELSVRYDRATCSWRTHRSLWDEDLSACSLTLPRWGSMRDGVLSELLTLERPTAENDAGLWPTPNVPNGGRSCAHVTDLRGTDGRTAYHNGKKVQVGLEHAAKYWPTPTASAGGPEPKGKTGRKLATAVKTWPTPTANEMRTTSKEALMARRLACKEKAKNGNGFGLTLGNAMTMAGETGGSLNPTWVEKLMGWPDDWTSLKPMSHVKMCFWLMGMNDGTETGRSEVLRMLRNGDAAQEIQRAIGRPIGVHEAALLLAELCEHANRPDEARVFMACAEALGEEVRGVQLYDGTTGAPHRPRQDPQRAGEHPDVMQALSRLLAHHGKTYWQDGSWEDAVPRVENGVAARVDRLKAIGNGQVPQCAAEAWRILTHNAALTGAEGVRVEGTVMQQED